MKEKIVAFAKKYKTPLLILAGVIIIIILVRASGKSGGAKSDGSPESLAKCLRDSGAKFYGSVNCGYCKKQKAMFGNAASDLPYIECTENQKACQDAGVTGYPTWVFKDGTKKSGAVPLETLKQLSGC